MYKAVNVRNSIRYCSSNAARILDSRYELNAVEFIDYELNAV